MTKTPSQYLDKVDLVLVRLELAMRSIVTSSELPTERKINLKFTSQSNNSFVYLCNFRKNIWISKILIMLTKLTFSQCLRFAWINMQNLFPTKINFLANYLLSFIFYLYEQTLVNCYYLSVINICKACFTLPHFSHDSIW